MILEIFISQIKSLSISHSNLLYNDNIEIIQEYHSDESYELYASEMMQVILNLLKNAQDNFKEKTIKILTLRLLLTQTHSQFVIMVVEYPRKFLGKYSILTSLQKIKKGNRLGTLYV